jgi:GAF domain-containing protein
VYRIAIATETTKSLSDLFPQIHAIISSVMPAENFYIMLYDKDRNVLRFQYFKDDQDEPYLKEIQPGQGLTAYVLRTGKSLLCTQAVHDELERQGAVKLLGVPSAIWLGVPLIIEGKTIGAMVVQHYTDPNAYGIRDQQMLEFVSTQVAIAISRKQAEDALQRQLKELSVLHRVSMTAAQASSVDQLINEVTHIIGTAVYVDDFGVALMDQAGKELHPHPSYHGESFEAKAIIPLTEGIMGHVATTGEPYYARDVRNDPYYLNTVPETLSEICVPIKSGENLVGVINAESRQINYFSEDDERLLNTIAGTLATVIEKLTLFDSERIRRLEAETLRQVAQVVTASLDINEVIRLMLDQLKNLFEFHTASVLLLGESGQPDLIAEMDYVTDKLTSYAPNGLLKDSANLRQMAQDLKPLISNTRDHPEWNWVPGSENGRSILAVPLVTHQRLIGVLVVDNETPHFFSENGVRVAQLLAQQMAIALENARLYRDALQASEKRAILHRASQEIAQASQDPERVYTAVHRAAVQLMPAEAFVITLVDEQNQETVGVYLVDKGGRWQSDRTPAGEGLSGRVISTGKPVITHDLTVEPIPGSVHFGEEEEVRSILAVPLRLGEKVTGMLSVHMPRWPSKMHGFMEKPCDV